MTIEALEAAKIAATKNKDMKTRGILTSMIDACRKAAITPKGRVELTEQVVNDALIKYQKTIQEMIDTCPTNREDLLAKYTAEMDVVKMYAPQLLTDTTVIRSSIETCLQENEIEPIAKNKGKIMKLIAPMFKGKADMKIVNKVIGEMLS